MTGDLLWYSLGRALRGTRFGLWVETHLPGHAKAEAMLQQRGQQWLFLSKFVLGFAPPIVFSIGWSGMDFKTFYKNSLLSILLWLPVLTGLAYGIVSGLAPLAATDFKKIEWVALGGFVLFIILDCLVANGVKALADRFLKADEENLTTQKGKSYYVN
jgi:membrane protein DedA with SNARE-associated domain